MVAMLVIISISIVSSIHVACYGAYKDAPYENFKTIRVVREILLSIFIGLLLLLVFGESIGRYKLFALYALVLVLSRIATELYKQFIRIEDQKIYKIPSQIHLFKTIVYNPLLKLVIFSVIVLFLVGGYYLAHLISSLNVSHQFKGLSVGVIAGFLIALGGGYKDGFFEGFDFKKFFRSPLVCGLVGYLLSGRISDARVLFFVSMGFERMIVEFYKGFIKSGYVPGKFKLEKPIYPQWLSKRKRILPIYAFSWLVMLVLVYLDM